MNGVLVIDKDPGWTSHDVVAKIRNILRIKKVGHTGTLDPFATGVLPLTLGRATRLTNYFMSSDKVYRGVMRFGFATTTYDVDGDPVGDRTRPELDASRLEEIFSRYRGTIEQTLPPYSAKKVQGRPLYSYARKGIEIAPIKKTIRIHRLTLHGVEGCEAEFELECSAGTYARSLAHDIGGEYGCGAHLVRLRRLQSGEFSIGQAVPLGEEGRIHPADLFLGRVIAVRDLLPHIPPIVVPEGDKRKVLVGMDLNLLTSETGAEEFRILDESGDLIAIARRIQTFMPPVEQPARWIRVHPHIIFN